MKHFLLKTVLLLCALVVGGSAWATDVTFTNSDFTGQGTSGTGSALTGATSGDVTITGKGYGNTSYLQIYGDNYLTITPINGSTITKVVLTGTSGTYIRTWTASDNSTVTVSGSSATWSGSSTSAITLTNAASAQARITSIKVTYTTAAPAYEITAQSNNTDYGTVSLSGSEITALPEAGYRVSTNNPYSVSPANSATVEQNGNSFTVNPTANTTVTINFEAIPTYEVSIMAPTGGTLVVKKGETVVSDGDFFEDGTELTVTATPDEEYNFYNWQAVDASTHTYTASNTGTYTINGSNVTFKANFTARVYHNAIFMKNGGIVHATVPTEEGSAIVFPATDPAAVEGKVFVGWLASAITGTTDEAPTFVTSATMGDADVTYYACYADRTPGSVAIITDDITLTTLGSFTTNTYDNWSDKKADNGSNAVYAGNSTTDGSNNIQIRSKNSNSGIVTTTSGGNVKKVSLVWGGGNTAGRELAVYGKNTAYSAASDLYDNSKQGTNLGSIIYGTSTELTINGDYTYLGLRSSDGAIYLESVSIDWETGTPDTYSGYCTTVAPDTRTAVNITSFTAANTTLVIGDTQATSVANDQAGWTAAYIYSSDNTAVATVDANGVITAVAKGKANISVTLNVDKNDANYKKGETFSQSIEVSVVNPSHNVAFYDNGNHLTAYDASVEEGEAITFPSDPSSIGGKVFMGWATASIDGTTNTAPAFVESATMSTSDIIYYAVFASSSLDYEWHRKSISEIEEAGTYALITTDGHAFNGTISSGHGQATTTAFSFTDNIATSAPEGTCEIELVEVTGGFKMYNADNGYLYATKAGSGGLAWHDSEDRYWLYDSSIENWQYEKSYSGNKARLRSYDNSSFRTYAANNGNILAFARKIAVPTYSDYCTSIAVTATIGLNGFTTFASPYALDLTNMTASEGDVVAYKAVEKDGSDIVFRSIDQTIPANTGILLKGTAGATVEIDVVASGDAVDGNIFEVNIAGTTFNPESDYYYFGMKKATSASDDLTFALFDPDLVAIPATKAYFKLSTSLFGSSVKTLNARFEDGESTGITEVQGVNGNAEGAYDLMGRKVAQPTRGLYIVNGKKVFINK